MMQVSDIAKKSAPDYFARRLVELEKQIAELRTARSNAGAAASDLLSAAPVFYNLPAFVPSQSNNVQEQWDVHTVTIPASSTFTNVTVAAWANTNAKGTNGAPAAAVQGVTLGIQPGANMVGAGTNQAFDQSVAPGQYEIIPLTAATSFSRTPGTASTFLIYVWSNVDVASSISNLSGVVTLLPIYTRG